jgi:hypothetical protein
MSKKAHTGGLLKTIQLCAESERETLRTEIYHTIDETGAHLFFRHLSMRSGDTWKALGWEQALWKDCTPPFELMVYRDSSQQ